MPKWIRGGGKTLIHQKWIICRFFLNNPSLSGCCGGVDGFCKGGICGCHKRAIVKWMLCHGGIDIGGVVVGMVDIVGYFTDGEIVLVLITTTTTT